jgi:hypothetical protein
VLGISSTVVRVSRPILTNDSITTWLTLDNVARLSRFRSLVLVAEPTVSYSYLVITICVITLTLFVCYVEPIKSSNTILSHRTGGNNYKVPL